MIDPRSEHSPDTLTLTAPARLHMGFLDPGGSLGRKFGSIGVALREICTRIRLVRRPGPPAKAANPNDLIEELTSRYCRVFGFPDSVDVEVLDAIPEHVGLGSGTQMALAVGVGLHRLFGSKSSVREIASAIGRGKRSGIGIAVFESGGFVVDGGRGPGTTTPPPLARFAVPDDWRFILAFDQRGVGLHGEHEIAAFQALPPFPVDDAARICHQLLLRGLPALAEADIATFGAVVTDIQETVGDYFAPAQGGRYTSPDVAACLNWLQYQGAQGIGQTSWGPTGFCLVATPHDAERLLQAARCHFAGTENLSLMVASARNIGAEILRNSPAARIPATQ
jgi:beta-RFAP synthase